MGELAYPVDHPKHPANTGKKFPETRTGFEYDYPPTHPARGGHGQPLLTVGIECHPVAGYKHLYGLAGATLAEVQRAFDALDAGEKAARMKWNEEGIPATPEEGA
jgi:hypothetical protein